MNTLLLIPLWIWFKSKISFRSKKGKSIPVKTQDGEYLFEGVQPGDTLYYQVETGADDKKGDFNFIFLLRSNAILVSDGKIFE